MKDLSKVYVKNEKKYLSLKLGLDRNNHEEGIIIHVLIPGKNYNIAENFEKELNKHDVIDFLETKGKDALEKTISLS